MLVALAASACSSKKSTTTPFDAGTTAPSDECSRTTSEVYYAGIDHASADGKLHVRIVDAVPAPPSGGDNTWTLALYDGAGKPIGGVLPHVVASQPGRGGLGPSKLPTVTVLDANAGTVKVEHLDLALTGVWRVDVRVGDPDGGGAPSGGGDDAGQATDDAGDTDAGSSVEVASFTFCVET